MPSPYDTFGNPMLTEGVPYRYPMLERHWPLSKARRAAIISKLDALVAYAAAAPASDPGEGDWDSIDAAFGCGERAAQYHAATLIRAALVDLGLEAPPGAE